MVSPSPHLSLPDEVQSESLPERRETEEPPPPPAPPVPAPSVRLPPNWKMAKDPEGKYYYYHSVTRKTQWDPPSLEGRAGGDIEEEEEEPATRAATAGPSRTSLSDPGMLIQQILTLK